MDREQVNHPDHYKGKVECIDAMEELFGAKNVKMFCVINAFKYLWRAGKKHGNSSAQDEAKALWYVTKGYDLGMISKGIFDGELNKFSIIEKNVDFLKRKVEEYKNKSK